MTTTDLQPADTRSVTLHRRTISFRELAGTGTPILLIHGLGSSAQTWANVPELLNTAGHHVIAIDLPGHGDSSKLPGDYSLGAMANSIRDLLDHLRIDRAHFVGHSLGGGITMQFAYQFPERVDRIVLDASGGLGAEIFPVLRAASLPGADFVIRAAINERTMNAAERLGSALGRIKIQPHALTPGALQTARWLSEPERRQAFLATVRSVIDHSGQRVSALDHLHLLDGSKVLIIWGDSDPMIPMSHGVRAHDMLPGSRMIVFPGAGHEPHSYDPARFASALLDHLAIS